MAENDSFLGQFTEGMKNGDTGAILSAGAGGLVASLGVGTVILIIMGLLAVSLITTVVFLPTIIAVSMPILVFGFTTIFTNMSLPEKVVASAIAGIGGYILLMQKGITIFMTRAASAVAPAGAAGMANAQGLIDGLFGIGHSVMSIVIGVLVVVLTLGVVFSFVMADEDNKILPAIGGLFCIGMVGVLLTSVFNVGLSLGVKTSGISNPVPYSQIGTIATIILLVIGTAAVIIIQRRLR